MMAFMKDLESTQGINIRYVHCNKAYENEMLDRLRKQEGWSINLYIRDMIKLCIKSAVFGKFIIVNDSVLVQTNSNPI